MFFLLFGAGAAGGLVGYVLGAGRRLLATIVGGIVLAAVGILGTNSWAELASLLADSGLLIGEAAAYIFGRIFIDD